MKTVWRDNFQCRPCNLRHLCKLSAIMMLLRFFLLLCTVWKKCNLYLGWDTHILTEICSAMDNDWVFEIAITCVHSDHSWTQLSISSIRAYCSTCEACKRSPWSTYIVMEHFEMRVKNIAMPFMYIPYVEFRQLQQDIMVYTVIKFLVIQSFVDSL